MTDELIGKKIGGYEVLNVIGRGGMATVYKAQQISMNRVVALKVLPRQFVNDDTYMQRFHREVKIIAQLEHRNIVPVHDYGEFEGQPYIVMRYMSGGTVDSLLMNGALSLKAVQSIIGQITPALDYAHSKGVLHRDIKPSNVLMDDGGGAFVTDFGIARILNESASGAITTQGVVGTPSYMSPEQAQGHPIDGRSDVYSVGVMLFEMVTGKRPFESDTPYSVAVMQVMQQPPAPRAINPDVLPSIEQVIYKAMSKRPEDRYQDMAMLAEALQRAVEPPMVKLTDTQPGLPRPTLPPPMPYYPAQPNAMAAQPVPTPPPSQAYVPRARRRPNLLVSAFVGVLIGCGLLGLLVAGAFLVINNNQQQEQTLIASLTLAAESSVATDLPSVALITVTPLPVLEEGELQGRPTSEGEATSAVAPIGSRDGGELPNGSVIYFAERNNNFDVYKLDLRTREDVRLTTLPATDMYAQVAPNRRDIVFVSDRDGDFELFMMDANGQNVRQLTSNAVTDRIPAWSPDGEWIVYSSDTRGDGTHDVYRIRPDGSGNELLFSNNMRNSHPRYSPDMRYLVFTSGVPADATTWDIFRIELETRAVIELTSNTFQDWSPMFTLSGDRIVYLTDGEGNAAIVTMNIDGTDRRILYDGAGYEWGVAFSRDARYIVFSSDATGQDELYIMNSDGSNVRQLTNNVGMYPEWLTYEE
jgi:serine/threonine protein kinase